MSQNILQYQLNVMETPSKQKERAMDIGSMLLSPPELKRSEHVFSSPMSMSMSRTPSQSTTMASSQSQGSSYASVMEKEPQRLPLSPPISPQTHKDELVRADEGTRDPPLFPREDSDNASREPLFPPQTEEQAVISSHVATNGQVCADEDYKLILDVMSNVKFHSVVGANYKKDPQKWYRQEMGFLDFYTKLHRKAKADAKAAAASPRKPATQRRLAPAPEGGVRKKVTTPRVQRMPKPKRSPPQHTFDAFAFPARDVAPKAPKLATSRDDIDFNSIPDFCPPTTNLGNNTKALKADWKGNMLDLSMDPDRHLLHEAEVHLAATLRLSCAVYLSSKRRIFVARVQCMNRGKDFRKTDAQQACKIDVNKASKLWTAFEKVGWFHERHFVGKHV